MRVSTFIAKNSRGALMQVKEQLGDDAIILRNRRVGDRIEITATTDLNQSIMHRQARHERAQGNVLNFSLRKYQHCRCKVPNRIKPGFSTPAAACGLLMRKKPSGFFYLASAAQCFSIGARNFLKFPKLIPFRQIIAQEFEPLQLPGLPIQTDWQRQPP